LGVLNSLVDINNDGKQEIVIHYQKNNITTVRDKDRIDTYGQNFDYVVMYNYNSSTGNIEPPTEVCTRFDRYANIVYNINKDDEKPIGDIYKFYFVDIDNDAIIDRVVLKNESIDEITTSYGGSFALDNIEDIKMIDFDGDGQVELMAILSDGSASIWKYILDCNLPDCQYFKNIKTLDKTYNFNYKSLYPGDFNGDGKTDFLSYNNTWNLYYSTGKDLILGILPQNFTNKEPNKIGVLDSSAGMNKFIYKYKEDYFKSHATCSYNGDPCYEFSRETEKLSCYYGYKYSDVWVEPKTKYESFRVGSDECPTRGQNMEVLTKCDTIKTFGENLECYFAQPSYFDAVYPMIDDINNDGKSDIILTINNVIMLFISNGSSFTYKNLGSFSNVGSRSFINLFLYTVDIDGSGQKSIIYGCNDLNFRYSINPYNNTQGECVVGNYVSSVNYYNSLHEKYKIINFKDIDKPINSLFVNSFLDGLNNNTTITYSVVSNNTYDKIDTESDYFRYYNPTISLKGSILLATNITTKTPSNIKVTDMTYTFSGGQIHLLGKGFLGFKTVSSTNNINQITSATEYKFTSLDNSSSYYTWPYIQTVSKNGTTHSKTTNSLIIRQKPNTNTLFDNTYLFFPLIDSYVSVDNLKNIQTISTVNNFDVEKGRIINQKSVRSAIGSGDSWTFETIQDFEFVSGSQNISRLSKTTNKRLKSSQGSYTSVLKYDYDNSAFPLRVTSISSLNPANNNEFAKTTYTKFDNYGNIESTTNSVVDLYNTKPRSNSKTYDKYGRFITSSTDVSQLTTYVEYRVNDGLIKSKTDPNGLKTVYEYLPNKNKYVTQITLPDGIINKLTSDWSVGKEVYLSKYEVSHGATSTVFYNSINQKIEETSNAGFKGKELATKYQYNPDGSLFIVFVPGNSTTYNYDEVGRIKSEVNSTNTVNLSYAYTPSSTVYTINDKILNQYKTLTYDALGNLTNVSASSGSIDYTYEASGKLTKTDIKGDGNQVIHTYDQLNLNKTSVSDKDRGRTDYKYNGFGELVYQKDANGTVTNLFYDDEGRLTDINVDANITVSVDASFSHYDYYTTPGKLGLTKSITRDGIKEVFDYDNFYRKISTTTTTNLIPGGNVLPPSLITYNPTTGRAATISYPTGLKVEYKYDAVGNLSEIIDITTGKKIWTCVEVNTLNQVKTISLNNESVLTQFDYDPSTNFLDSIKTGTLSDPTSIQNLGFTFNNAKQLKNRTDGSLSESFIYEEVNNAENLDRLVTSQVVGQNPQNTFYKENQFGVGNIGSTTYAGKYNYDVPGHLHAISSVSGTSSSDQMKELQTLCEYDAENKISYISNDIGLINRVTQNQAKFTYGVDGRRFRMDLYTPEDDKVSLIKIYIENSEFGYNSSGQLIYKRTIISAPTGVCAVYQDSGNMKSFYYVHTDYLGSWLAITDENATVTNRYSYDAWGRPRNSKTWQLLEIDPANALVNVVEYLSSMQPRFDRGYTGHEMMAGFGLINMNGRLYDPYLQRFLNADNYIQSAENAQSYNKYSYCFNNPLSYTDPSGYWSGWDDLIVGGIGFAYGYVSYGLTQGDWGWKAAGSGAVSAGMFLIGYYSGGATSASSIANGFAAAPASAGIVGNHYAATVALGYSARMVLTSAISSVLPSYSMNFGNLTLSASPAFMIGSGGYSVGLNWQASYRAGDFTFGVAVGGSEGKSGFTGLSDSEARLSGFAGYDDGSFGIGLSSTIFESGKTSQRTGRLNLRYNDFSLSYENDGLPFNLIGLAENNADSYRTASATLGYKDFTIGMLLFTGYRDFSQEPKDDNPDYPHGYVANEEINEYNAGILYAGYGNMRAGWNHDDIRHVFQNRFAHGFITKQAWIPRKDWPNQPYFVNGANNPYTNY